LGTLTIRLDEKLDRELARLAKQTGRTKSGVAREALRRQLSIQRFRKLRHTATPYAAAAGYFTDEDVFLSRKSCRTSPYELMKDLIGPHTDEPASEDIARHTKRLLRERVHATRK
jgi:predicted transcriptional regulator